MSTDASQIQIMGEPQIDPNVCKFTIDRPVYAEGSVRCTSKEMAEGSPLLQALFAIDGITQVLAYGNTLVVAKTSHDEWPVLGKQIGAAIRGSFASGQPLIADTITRRLPSEKDLRAKLETLFQEQINPAVASHGGHVEIIDVRGSAVYISFSGGCQGCASSSVTLKQGIERMVREQVPEITEVLDITDHTAGMNPYYK